MTIVDTLPSRALCALHNNHPAYRRKWPASDYVDEERDALLTWAATLSDRQILRFRNVGVKSVAWIRAQPIPEPPPVHPIAARSVTVRAALAFGEWPA